MVNQFLLKVILGILCLGDASRQPVPMSNMASRSLVCDLTVDAGPDIVLCQPDMVQLTGTVIPDPVFVLWEPSTGLNDPTILNPVADVTGSITYTLTAWGVDPENPNIIVNGDFEDGNVGFTSDYLYVQDLPFVQDEMVPAGTYTVINNPFLVHEAWSPCQDHTPGAADQMMLINGELALQNFWCQTVNVLSNTFYNVEAWVSSVHPSSPAILQFSINGTPFGQIINAPSNTCEWIPFNAVWNSGSTTTAEICIINLNTTAFGNDFALDDISMVALCEVSDEVNIVIEPEPAPLPDISGPEVVCEDEIATYTASLPPDPPIENYVWSVSGGLILTGQGTAQVSVEWQGGGNGSVCLMIETACDENEHCIDVTVHEMPVVPVINGPSSLCPGENGTFYTNVQDPDHMYNWIIPSQVNIISGQGTNEITVEWAGVGDLDICLEVSNDCGTNSHCVPLMLHENYLTFFDTMLCEGQTIVINGTVYGNGNFNGIEDFISVNGCDSLVEITIEEAPGFEYFNEVSLCPGDSVFLEGAYQTEAGIYVDSFFTSTGCDSILITEVEISLSDTTYIFGTTCTPGEEGVTIETFTSGACDSTVITQIILLGTDTTTVIQSSCMAADTGSTTIVLTNISGCDSIIIIQTNFQESDTTELFQTSCNPDDEGVVSQLFTNSNGCDSLVIITTSFALSDTTLLTGNTCSYSDTATTAVLLTNSKGCDSLVITQIVYVGSDTTYLSLSSCASTDTGIAYLHLTNSFGCDSIVSTYTSLLPEDSTSLLFESCDPLDTGLVVQVFQNVFGCDSIVTSYTALVAPQFCELVAAFSIIQPLCFGDTAWLSVNIGQGLAPFNLTWTSSGNTGSISFNGSGAFQIPFQIAGTSFLELESANGLSMADTVQVFLPEELTIEAVTDTMNGFGVPCFGDTSAAVSVNILSSGTPPLMYAWSTGATAPFISQIGAGSYIVTVTDKNNCVKVDTVSVLEPPAMAYIAESQDILCYGNSDGMIVLNGITGGVLPWMTSVNGGPFSENFVFDQLQGGNYQIVIRDANGCTLNENFVIEEPSAWSLALGPDTVVSYGASITISPAIIGVPGSDIELTWSDEKCEDCEVREFEITDDMTLIVTATDANGCKAADTIVLRVVIPRQIVIPNVFSPNGDGINDHFFISANTFLEEIDELYIFDRWGNMVFRRFGFAPNDPMLGWDGKMDGQPMNPAVFAYKVVVRFRDGSTRIYHGDVTLVR